MKLIEGEIFSTFKSVHILRVLAKIGIWAHGIENGTGYELFLELTIKTPFHMPF